jgi:hypothetical protein
MNRQHGVKAGIIPEHLWRRLYIQGMNQDQRWSGPRPRRIAADLGG